MMKISCPICCQSHAHIKLRSLDKSSRFHSFSTMNLRRDSKTFNLTNFVLWFLSKIPLLYYPITIVRTATVLLSKHDYPCPIAHTRTSGSCQNIKLLSLKILLFSQSKYMYRQEELNDNFLFQVGF